MRKVATVALVALAVLWTLPVAAQRGRGGGGRELNEAITNLGSESREEVRGALEGLGLAGNARAVAPIAARIRRGLPPDLLEVAVDTLTILGRPEAGPVLFTLTRHRRPAIRLKAVQGIVATRPRGAERVLVEALNDADPAVRAAAAEGLGTIEATGSLDALFHAFDRQVPGAATAIAQLARPAEVDRFLAYVGRVPFDQVSPVLDEMLHRESLAESARVSIVHRITELGTPEVRAFLESYVASSDSDDAVRRAAEAAIPRIGQ